MIKLTCVEPNMDRYIHKKVDIYIPWKYEYIKPRISDWHEALAEELNKPEYCNYDVISIEHDDIEKDTIWYKASVPQKLRLDFSIIFKKINNLNTNI